MTVTPEKVKALHEFGLTEYQARAYLALLDLGVASASQVPPIAKVPRTRVYATMNQLHERGLVEIVPETPLKYKAVPFATFLRKRAKELRDHASEIETRVETLAREFPLRGGAKVETGGRFEAIYGRRNVREKLTQMYTRARKQVVSIGTSKSPGRILKAFGPIIEDRAAEGVVLRYAFPVEPENLKDVQELSRFSQVRSVDLRLPIYAHVADDAEALLSHPIPDDESFYQGEDIAIWTDDPGIVQAMRAMVERLWEMGVPPGTVDFTHPLLDTARKYLSLLGVGSKPVFETMGRSIGEQIAATLEADNEVELFDRISEYWTEHGLGRVRIAHTQPLVVYLERTVNGGSPEVTTALHDFAETILRAILEKKLGLKKVQVMWTEASRPAKPEG